MGDLSNPARFREKLTRVIAEKDAVCRATYGVPLDTAGMAEQYLALGERIKPLIDDASALVNSALDAGRSVLFEGAQGTMLDIDFGTYPYVTSSNAISGGACTGLGVGPTRINGVIGVTKAYTTRVGSGPFPTEMPDLEATEVRDRGKEYGAVTGKLSAVRLARFGGTSVRGAHQWNFVAGGNQAGRVRHAKRNPDLRWLPIQG